MADSPLSRTPYEVLGVSPRSTDDELRRAYRRLLRETHPDTGGSAAEFHAVQAAWEQVGSEAERAAYDSGAGARRSAPDDRAAGDSSRASGAHRPEGSSLRARSYGHPGGVEREHFLSLMREWVGRGVELPDPYDPTLVRSAPREIRRWLAKALAEEETARIVSTLGIGYTIWNNVLVDRAGRNIDQIVLGPAGLFAVQSEDWGSTVRISRGELEGDGIGEEEQPFRVLGQAARTLQKTLGVRFTGLVIVVPDDDLDAAVEQIERGRQAGAVVVRRSVLPQVLRNGVGGGERASVDRVFELRSRLQQGIRFV
ncbi:DnaJ domain-containing protein [Subtercola boreus]|uniref:Heat-shock protein n=1 Tax=Subtercola boreus TaxID=120213 RepID=A0A3E0WCH3_9MICO|nr:DnaJ domain-containing protein [Subtercola boreus]RFA21065.1 heat-shock protein [Subtercola boreus]RFA21449.1 heat-shock protein [Subtercola boreus]RFA27420.1 heat-shock protein [Subtercola boreus]